MSVVGMPIAFTISDGEAVEVFMFDFATTRARWSRVTRTAQTG